MHEGNHQQWAHQAEFRQIEMLALHSAVLESPLKLLTKCATLQFQDIQ
jgi:hypothetical protein